MNIITMQVFMQRQRQYNPKLSPPEATLGTTHSAFLGHTFTLNGIRPSADRLAAPSAMPMSTTVKRVRSLPGGLSYYLRFLINLSKRTKPIDNILKKGDGFKITTEMERAIR